MHTDSDLAEVEIVEDPNQPKEPDVIHLTNLDDENKQSSGTQDEPNKEGAFLTRKTRKMAKMIQLFKPWN